MSPQSRSSKAKHKQKITWRITGSRRTDTNASFRRAIRAIALVCGYAGTSCFAADVRTAGFAEFLYDDGTLVSLSQSTPDDRGDLLATGVMYQKVTTPNEQLTPKFITVKIDPHTCTIGYGIMYRYNTNDLTEKMYIIRFTMYPIGMPQGTHSNDEMTNSSMAHYVCRK